MANDLVLAHSLDAVKFAYALVLAGGPIVYLLGSAIYKRVVYGAPPTSHVAGALALAVLMPIAMKTNLLGAVWLTAIVMLAVGYWEMHVLRKRRGPIGEMPTH